MTYKQSTDGLTSSRRRTDFYAQLMMRPSPLPFEELVRRTFSEALNQASPINGQLETPMPVQQIILMWYVRGRAVASSFSEILLDKE